jgi:hypothetical protein
MNKHQQSIAVRLFATLAVVAVVWSLLVLPALIVISGEQPSFKDLFGLVLHPIFWLPIMAGATAAWLAAYIRVGSPSDSAPPRGNRWRLGFLIAVPSLAIALTMVNDGRRSLRQELQEAERRVENLESAIEDLRSRLSGERTEIIECLNENLRNNQEMLRVLEEKQQTLIELSQCEQENLAIITEVEMCRLRKLLP